ncbi:MAG: hypothetical protein AAB610_02295 [Patescibacteria group bacterium]
MKKNYFLIAIFVFIVALAIVLKIFKQPVDTYSAQLHNNETPSLLPDEDQIIYSTVVTTYEGHKTYNHSMTGSFGVVSGTTDSISNPYTACEEDFLRSKPEPKNVQKLNKAEWKRFSSPEYGFSFQYPANWKIKNDKNLIELENEGYFLTIQRMDGVYDEYETGGSLVCDQAEYYEILVDNTPLVRGKETHGYEMSRDSFYGFCFITKQDHSCIVPYHIDTSRYEISFRIKENTSINPVMIDLMDEIVGSIITYE